MSRFKLTNNEHLIILALIVVAMAYTASHAAKWYGNYQLWKINGYISQGTMLLNETTLLVPDSIPDSQKTKYCDQVNSLSSSNQSIMIGFVKDQMYCGCINPNDQLPYSVNYKLFKDKIIYQCNNILLETNLIPRSLLGK